MKAAVLFSGGKDSCYSLYWALNHGFDVRSLVTMVPENDESYMFHYPNLKFTKLQAESIGVPQAFRRTHGRKEEELGDLAGVLRTLGIDAVVCGALASSYQKYRLEHLCRTLGLAPVSPFWGTDQAILLGRMLADGFEIIISSVSAEGFDSSWLGRRVDQACLSDLLSLHEKYGVSVGGEGGEFETFVLNAPFFNKRIAITDYEKRWTGTSGQFLIKKAALR